MLGLDALDGAVFERLVAAGRLPNLGAFAAQSTRLEIASDGELLHGSLWPTFASGRGPGQHGVYFWTQWLAEEMRHVRNTHSAFAFEPFWAALPGAGRTAAVVDVPHTPLVRAHGVRQMVGWGLHDEYEAGSWPGSFADEIRKRVGRNPLSFDTLEPQTARDKLLMARDMRRGVHLRAKLAALLLDGGADLVITTFSELHKAGHYLTSSQQLNGHITNLDAVAAILGALDRSLPRILAAAGRDCHVFIFALHGMQEQVEYSQFGPQILDLLFGRRPLDRAEHPDLIRRIRDLLPDNLHRAIWRRLPAALRSSRQGTLSTAGAESRADPLFTVAHDGHPAIRARLMGRESGETVSRAQLESLLRDLSRIAASLTADDGRVAYSGLIRPQAKWAGPRAHRLPDAMLAANPHVLRTSSLRTTAGQVVHSVRPEARNGIHTGRGFGFFRPARGVTAARTMIEPRDFAPTVLRLFGTPIPAHLEGTVFVA